MLSSYPCHLLCKDLPDTKECGKKCELDNLYNNTSESSSFFDHADLTPPVIMCQELAYFEDTVVGKVVLFWNFTLKPNAEHLTPLFILEAQQDGNENNWNVVGMTNHTLEEVIGLEPGARYRFRIHAVFTSEILLGPVTSRWIFVLGSNATLGIVSNITAVNFHSNSTFIDAMIDWELPEGLPCSYSIFWHPSSGNELFEHKTVILPQDKLPATLPDLIFQTNYSIDVVPLDISKNWTTMESMSCFMTPSCIDVKGKDYSVCPPGPPQNIEAFWLNETCAVVTWSLPEQTSAENILKYFVTVLKEDAFDKERVVPADYSATVPGNETSALIPDLQSQNRYFIEVYAVTEGGFGKTVKIQLMCAELCIERSEENFPTLGISLGLASLLLLCIVIIPFIWWRCRRWQEKALLEDGNSQCFSIVESDPYIIPHKQVKVLNVLGHGAFGIVHKGQITWKKRKEIIAVKMFLSPVTEDLKYQLFREVEMMKIIGRHRHIVGFHGCCIDGPRLCLLMEYCPYGDLHTMLINLRSKQKVYIFENYASPDSNGENGIHHAENSTSTVAMLQPEETGIQANIVTGKMSQLLSYMLQVALGMKHISSLKLVHRDIAARNILLFTENIVKIGDFGLMRDVYENKTYSMIDQKRLPVRWMSIEAISKQTFTMWSDVWSYGILMWEIITLGIHPYPDLGNEQILPFLNSNRRLPKTDLCSQELYDVMLSCWNETPTSRPTFQDLCHKLGSILEIRNSYLQLNLM